MTSFVLLFCGNGWWWRCVSVIIFWSCAFYLTLIALYKLQFCSIRVSWLYCKNRSQSIETHTLNGVLFFFTMLNTLYSDAFEEVALALVLQLWTRDQIDTSQCNLSFYLYIPIKCQLCSTCFFHHNNYKHSAKLNLVCHGHWAFDNQETDQKGHLTWLDHSPI